MARDAHDRQTGNLLDWDEAPKVAARFEEQSFGAGPRLEDLIALAVSRTMRESKLSREDIAEAMGSFLGCEIKKTILDAYASQSRTDHPIGLARAVALAAATGDPRLFGEVLEPIGFAVIPSRYLAAVDEAVWAEREEIAKANREQARKKWKGARR